MHRRFGSRTVFKKDTTRDDFWYCRCDCGVVDSVKGARLVQGLGNRCRACFYASLRVDVYEKPRVTGAALLAEGIVEVGAVAGTNIIFAQTKRRWVLFFADQVSGVMKDAASNGEGILCSATTSLARDHGTVAHEEVRAAAALEQHAR